MKSIKVAALLGGAIFLGPCCATPYPQSQGEGGLATTVGNRPIPPLEFNIPQGMLRVEVTFPEGDTAPLNRQEFDRIVESLEDFASFQGRPMAILSHPVRAHTYTLKGDVTPVPHEPYLTVGETEAWLGELRNQIRTRGDFYAMHIVVRKRGVVAQSGQISNLEEGDSLASYVSVAVSATAAPSATSSSVLAVPATPVSVPAAPATTSLSAGDIIAPWQVL